MNLVEVTDLNKKYITKAGEIHVLKGLSLEIPKNKLVVVMGSSGSGKTTFLHLLGALDRPDSGQIMVGEEEKRDITTFKGKDSVFYRRTTVGFVFQQFNLVPSLTALENVALPLVYAGENFHSAKEKAREILEELGLGERTSHRPGLLSGGEKQRVAVSRALVHNPDLLLADEPTGNLDSKNAQKILDLLKKIRETRGETILLVTHDPAIADQADQVFHLQDGVLVED